MKPILIQYLKCDTCRKAAKWLKENGIEFDARDIVMNNPTQQELEVWIVGSGIPIAKFFNTSGLKYREMGLKDVVRGGSDDELIKLLASDGMLVKRPLLIAENGVGVGFNPDVWSEIVK